MIPAVRIGPVCYTVREVSRLIATGADGNRAWANGEISASDTQIRIEAELDGQAKIVALWHEAIHGMLDHAGYADHPEPLVTALGYSIVQFIRDNPALVKATYGRYAAPDAAEAGA